MKRYLVKTVYVATENNENFKGMSEIVYSGKRQTTLGCYGSAAEATYTRRDLWKHDIIEYGYTRRCDAARSWIYKNPQNDEYWRSETSIVEMEI